MTQVLCFCPDSKICGHVSFDDKISSNGYRIIRRFCEGVPDGCEFPLSLKASNEAIPDKWTKIISDSENTLCKIEACSLKRNKHCSSLISKILFINPNLGHHWNQYNTCNKQHFLLRSCISEFGLNLKESQSLLDDQTRERLKLNVSCQDIRHLASSHFFNDQNKIDLIFDKNWNFLNKKSFKNIFNRQTFNPTHLNHLAYEANRKKVYEQKLKIIQHNFKKIRLLDFNQESKQNDIINFDHLDAVKLADGLTLVEKKLFLNLNETELSRLLFKPSSINQETCPHITNLLGFQRRVYKLFISSILEAETSDKRAERIAFIIEVSKELKNLRNWQSLNSLIKSLQSPPIARLKKTWKVLFLNYPNHYLKFFEFLKIFENEMNLLLNYRGPCIPLFDDWLNTTKGKCADRIKSLKTRRIYRHWSRTSAIINWVFKELENMKLIEPPIHKNKEDKNTSLYCCFNVFQSKVSKRSTLDLKEYKEIISPIFPIKQSFKKKKIDLDDIFESRTYKKSKDDQMILIGIIDLKEDEKKILEEISQRLNGYQVKANLYSLVENEEILKFILWKDYNSLNECLKISYQLEPTIDEKGQNK